MVPELDAGTMIRAARSSCRRNGRRLALGSLMNGHG
jgi:hypothetical protein